MSIFKITIIFALFVTQGIASDKIAPKEKIGQMLMVGFYGIQAPFGSPICQDIMKYNLGGVILFDNDPTDKSKPKNIYSRDQLQALTQELQACSPNGDLLIAVDQEGGKVQRLKSRYGFYGKFPQASSVSKTSTAKARAIYEKMGVELKSVGINFNLAPVVDLSINPKNVVINRLGRSFGGLPDIVSLYSKVFIDAMHNNGVLTSLKHFPGHGSSLGDTHQGFVDVTHDWKNVELAPYKQLIKQNIIDTIMVSHVFNATIDDTYPASLSSETIDNILRNQLGYDGVVITDDLQMGAIIKKYKLKETLKLSINAGVDILLFGNQLSPNNMVTTKTLVENIQKLVQSGEVDIVRIEQSYKRIQQLKNKLH